MGSVSRLKVYYLAVITYHALPVTAIAKIPARTSMPFMVTLAKNIDLQIFSSIL